MVDSHPLIQLPSSEELPDSDDTPVDNEVQYLFASLLWSILAHVWSPRQDWFLGANMGIYYDVDNPRIPIVPDCFLSLDVTRHKGEFGRKSYVLWEENYTPPMLVIEHVSHSYNGEYDDKMQKYVKLGALYYAIYNPEFWQRDKHLPLEVYKLQDNVYLPYQVGQEPVWMPEIGLGIGKEIGIYNGWQRQWLFWYDQQGQRHTSYEEVAQQEHNRAEWANIRAEQEKVRAEQERVRANQEKARADRLQQKLRQLGIDPDDL